MSGISSVSAITIDENRVEIRERHTDDAQADTVIIIPISFASTIVQQLTGLLEQQQKREAWEDGK